MFSNAESSKRPFWRDHVRKRRRTMKPRNNPGYKGFAGLFMLFHTPKRKPESLRVRQDLNRLPGISK